VSASDDEPSHDLLAYLCLIPLSQVIDERDALRHPFFERLKASFFAMPFEGDGKRAMVKSARMREELRIGSFILSLSFFKTLLYSLVLRYFKHEGAC